MPPKKGTERYKLWMEHINAAAIKRRNIPLSTDHAKKISSANKGRVKSEEECKHISESLKNKPKSQDHKKHLSESNMGKPSPRKGATLSADTKNKIRIARTGTKSSMKTRDKQSVSMRGDKNPSYKGGVTRLNKNIRRSLKYRLWILSVFERDDYTCQDCKKRGVILNAHHCIKQFWKIIEDNNITTLEEAFNCEELWDINNGVTLCIKCHKKRHIKEE
jgi:hypothetical protein